MKKKISILTIMIAIASILIILNGCTKELEYSCDEDANEYAKMNFVPSQNISRDSLVKLPIKFQFAVFNSLSNANKLRIFREKLDILKTEVNFSVAELAIIDSVYNSDSNIYTQTSPFAAMEIYVKDSLGWDEEKIFVYVGTWFTRGEVYNGFHVMKMTDDMNAEGGGTIAPDCLCNLNIACGVLVGDCEESWEGCKETKDGCGWLGNDPCKGRCKNIAMP